jgi:predicted amidohydrolase
MTSHSDERILGYESQVDLACLQIEPKVGMMEENLEKTLVWIERASSLGNKILVLPELCVSGYVFNSRAEAFELSEGVPGGKSIDAWEESAIQNNIYIVAGIAEKQGSSLYNSSVLIGPEGYIGKYRKLHLWFEENLFFEPGNMGLPIFNLPFGRMGMMVCYDMWFPEVPRILSLRGADLIVIPTNWPYGKDPKKLLDITDSLIKSHSHINGVFIAACDRVGMERGVKFKGRSIITSHTGEVLEGPASAVKEEMVIAKVNLSDSRIKQRNKINNHLRDRRRDIYDEILGYKFHCNAHS